ncbi:MAG: NDP-sugar synthase [Candidatus Nanopelagicaceae bacterium]|nr:NDP-sugar synthase [Candidatus Nanopelagicaceae bacterium]
MVTKGILLVGGKGTRLAPLTNNTPKPMLRVAGKPVTEHQIIKARNSGITELVLATSYLAEVFEPYFGDGSEFGISITYAVEETPLGTGGAIANAASQLKLRDDDSVVIFNGDVLSGHNLDDQISLHEKSNSDVTLYLTKVQDPRAYGCVPIDQQGRVQSFLEKMENPIADTINAGCYIFRNRAISQIPIGQVVSVERDTFPKLLSEGFNLFGYLDNNYWIDMGTPHSFIKASKDLILNPELSTATSGVVNDSLIGSNTKIHPTAQIGEGSTIGDGVQIQENCIIYGSMISSQATIGAGSEVRDSYIAAGKEVPPNSKLIGQIIGG